MKKRLLASLLSLCLLVGLLPTAALAVDEVNSGEPSPVCICEALCGEEEVDESCPVCGKDYTLCAYEGVPNDQGEPVPCTVNEGCTLEAGHDGECVLPDGSEGPTDGDENKYYEFKDVTDPALPTAEEKLAEMIAALPAPEDIDPLDEEQVKDIYDQISTIYAFAEENGMEVEDDETVNAVIAALYPVKTLEDTDAEGTKDNPWNISAEGGRNEVFAYLEQNNQNTENPTYTLIIFGTGAITDYTNTSSHPWVSQRTKVTTAAIGEGITHLGNRTFEAFSALTTVEFPNSLISIGNNTFSNCTQLSSIDLPENLESIGSNAFLKCGLTSLTIPASVKTISNFAFEQNKLIGVDLPDGLETLGTGVFKGNNFTSLPNIPLGITTLNATFGNCTQLKNIEIPSHVKHLIQTFINCTSLTEVTIPKTVESYCGVFQGCTGLTKAVIESKADNIGGANKNSAFGVFTGCTSLKTVVVPEWVTTIGVAAFKNCSSLETTDFIERASNISQDAFQGCKALKGSLNLNASTIGIRAFDACSNLGPDISIANATSVGDSAFRNCTSLTGTAYGRGTSTLAYVLKRSVTAILNGGTFDPDTKFTANTLAIPIKNGNIFAGWYTKNGTSTGDWGSEVTTPTAKSTYYAKWYGINNAGDVQLFGEYQLTTILPEGASVTGWSSSDSSIATVDSNGKVTAHKLGEVKITASITGYEGHDSVSATIQIVPRKITYTSAQDTDLAGGITYNFSDEHQKDAIKFAWADEPKTAVQLDQCEGTDLQYTYQVDSEGSPSKYTYPFLPMPVKLGQNGQPAAYTVEMELLNPNYVFDLEGKGTSRTVSVQVMVQAENAIRAYLADAAVSGTEFPYTGQPIIPVTGTLKAYEDETSTEKPLNDITSFDVYISGLDGTEFNVEEEVHSIAAGTKVADAKIDFPSEIGTYLLTVSGVSDTHYIYKSMVYYITKGDAGVSITASPSKLSGGGTVTLNVSTPGSGTVNVTCDDHTVAVSGSGSSWSASLPNETKTYTFTASYGGSDQYKAGTATCTVSVTRYSSDGSGSGSSSSYTVDVDSGKHGTVTVSPNRAGKGDTVTVTVKPDKGYELDELTVTDKNGGELKLTRKSDTKYTFTMPNGRVTVEASFAPEAAPDVPGISFVDVPTDAYYAEAVAWAVENGITSGTTATTFSPNAACTRGQMVTFLWRAAGSPKAAGGNPFTDLDADAYYYDAVLWAVANGITSGTSATTFSPDAVLTRGQTVTFLYRANGAPAVSGGSFADVDANAYYADAVAWAVAEDITRGTGNSTFSPDAACTRGQIVTFLYRDAQ